MPLTTLGFSHWNCLIFSSSTYILEEENITVLDALYLIVDMLEQFEIDWGVLICNTNTELYKHCKQDTNNSLLYENLKQCTVYGLH